MMRTRFPIIPTFLLRYNFDTKSYFKNCTMPIVVFHGTTDEVINYSNSLELQKVFKKEDTLITLENQGHMGITDNETYKESIKEILK